MCIKSLILSLFLLLTLSVAPLWALDCSNPPSGFGNAWWSEYASWCTSCGGTPASSTTSCTPGPNWGGNSGNSGAGSQSIYRTGDFATDMTFYMMEQTLPVFFDAIGQQLACEIDPNCPQKVRQRQIEEQQRLEREARLEAAETERRRQEIERRVKFEQAKERLFGEMRLQPDSGDLQPRNIGLETHEVTGSLQTRTLVPHNLAAGPTLGAASLRSPLARVSCGAFLLRKSEQAAARGDFQEAAFLSNEAASLIGGEKITSAISCPPPPEVPQVGQGEESSTSRQKALEIEAALKKRSRFVRSMYQRVAEQGAQYREASEAVRQAEEQKKLAQLRLEKARTAKAEVEARLRPEPSSPIADSSTPQLSAETPSIPEAESAMAAALAALEAAEAAYTEADAELQHGLKNKANQEKKMQVTRSLFEEVKQDPTQLDSVLKTLSENDRSP